MKQRSRFAWLPGQLTFDHVVRKAVPADSYAFDMFTQEVIDQLRSYQDDFITALTDDARDIIEAAVLNGARQDLSPEEIAAQIRDAIGLTDRQYAAVQSFRTQLETGDAGALSRALRDPAFDDTVNSILDGEDVSASAIDNMVEAYAQRYLDYRAKMIADTESIRATNLGLHDSYAQAIDRGVFPDSAVKRYWQTAMDEGVCPICESIPDANENGVGVDEPFDSDDGPQDDPPIHPNCRCGVEYVTDLEQVPMPEEDTGDDEEQAA